MQVAAVQMACGPRQDDNIAAALSWTRQAAEAGAQVVCLQELFASRYFCQSEDHAKFELAESIPGPTSDALSETARRLQVVLVAGIFERRGPGIFHNSAIVVERDGSIAGIYRKMHIPDDPYFYEKFFFTPGDSGFQSFLTSIGQVGVCICWDQWFPEAARLTALQGAEILVYPTAIGWQAPEKDQFGESQRNAWLTMLCSHAIANGVFVVAPNRVGEEDHIEFWGSSLIADPYGNQLQLGSSAAGGIIQAECDLNLIETARTHWPFFRDRRIDAYAGLTQRWGSS